ncbi:malto-oligosyltrehalose trehalohydrolase [Olivibacter sp. XZL3]|uniref:malto-oligosyltrehalose trehalohydrolase n=1 Tax=Olivibacter sp. XZL3 TaxID=1735116 RepID=UPI0010651343|nr:malto-oligosyltrehalose trehalohydrolase [Olivibacter sp. XZL3]
MIGAIYKDNHTIFKVWAPTKERMVLHIVSPKDIKYDMRRNHDGYFIFELNSIWDNLRYYYQPDGEKDYPDPASRYQPEGVHGPSQVIDHQRFVWDDLNWRGIAFDQMLLYELHVGTFSKEGTFQGILSKLDDLKALGVTAIQLMPICQFPGVRNWGYDGVYPFAVQNSYGDPDALKELVNNCHRKGLAVFVDVVYNHLGPEGNYFKEYGPYFTDQYKTPWGQAMNLDGEWSDGVRDYFLENIAEWFIHYHVDGLRVDAVHAMFDNGSIPFWEVACNRVRDLERTLGRRLYMIAESDYNHPRVVSKDAGGFGFDGQWLDDFHHALYTLIFPAGKKFYEDFGKIEQLAKAYKEGFVHTGEYVVARKKKYGASSAGIPGNRFVVFNQNHDQVGNKGQGDRLSTVLDTEKLKMAASAILLSPYIPMLFMGEEYAEENPFSYFIDHSDPELIEAVRTGRKKEFSAFMDDEDIPDPKDPKVFERSKLNWNTRQVGRNRLILNWYKKIIKLRFSDPVFCNFNKKDLQTSVFGKLLALQRADEAGKNCVWCLFNFSDEGVSYKLPAGFTNFKEVVYHDPPLPIYPQETEVNLPPWAVWVLKGEAEESRS